MRIQLDLPEEKVAEIKALMTAAQIDTYKDLFNNALTILSWALSEKRNGRTVASLSADEKNYRVLVMPCLESCSPQPLPNPAAANGHYPQAKAVHK